ncbi:hypothetical protein [Escherichia coli]|uniref:hypothetical protein n=1 Tax=Escherichia coli TaxID=562 RepID=UPI003CC7DF1D
MQCTGWFRYRSAAAPKDNTWYTGAKLGWSQYHDTVSSTTMARPMKPTGRWCFWWLPG